MSIVLENATVRIEFARRGAAIDRWVYKPTGTDVVLRCPDRNVSYHYCNTVVGPIANRISGAHFLNGDAEYFLDANEGRNCLHGGCYGVSECEWELLKHNATSVIFGLTTPAPKHLEDEDSWEHIRQGFPGRIPISARYDLLQNGVRILLCGNRGGLFDNWLNLVPHFYFQLGYAECPAAIDKHILQIHAPHYLPVDAESIPLGHTATVAETPLDFRHARQIGDTSVDHNFCLQQLHEWYMYAQRSACVLTGEDGLTLSVTTNQPGLQIYDARHLGRSHLAIEPQCWPNAVNTPAFDTYGLPVDVQEYRNESTFVLNMRDEEESGTLDLVRIRY